MSEAQAQVGSAPRDAGKAAPLTAGHGLKTVARAVDRGVPALGLDRPLPLSGGGCLKPDGIASFAAMDWIPDLGALLAEACRDQTMSGRQWFWLPPLALTGATPDEARFVARRLARLAGVPFVTMDVGTLQSGALSRSAPRGPDVRFPPHPVIALAASGCANPIILVLGAEQAPEDVALALGDLLDRESSSRWYCQAIGAVLDLSSISWMVAATSEHSLPSALYTRLAPLRIAVPLEPPHRRLRVLAAALEVLEDAEVEVSDVAPVLASLTDDDRTWSFFERASADRLEIDLRRHLLHAANVSLR